MLTTERCILRTWREEDLDPFAALNADPEVMEFFPGLLDRGQSDAFARRITDDILRDGFGLWALEVEGRFAGYVGLQRVTFDCPMAPCIEIGWRLARWAWGRGLASEAAREALRDGFDRLGAGEVFAFTTERNVRSRSVMERIGMTRRPELDFDHPNTPGWWGRHHVVFSVGRSASMQG